MIELCVFHKTKAKRFLERFCIAKRVIGIESDMIDAPRPRAARDVALRSIGHLRCEFTRRNVAFRFPKDLVNLAAGRTEAISGTVTHCRRTQSQSPDVRLAAVRHDVHLSQRLVLRNFAMSGIDQPAPPILAAPPPPKGKMSFLRFTRAMRDNWIATYSEEPFENDILVRRLLWQRSFLVNDPSGITRRLG